jgi:hypothetical protein
MTHDILYINQRAVLSNLSITSEFSRRTSETNADRSTLYDPDKGLLSTAPGTANILANGGISQSWGLQGEEIFSMEENKDFDVSKAALPTSPTAIKGDHS